MYYAHFRCLAALIAGANLLAPNLLAQCETTWESPLSGQAVIGTINAMERWDPDGPGPLGERLVVGGTFALPANLQAANLAMFDPATETWSLIGGAANAGVTAIHTLPNGDLAVAGSFTQIGATTVRGIGIFDGTTWTDIGQATGGAASIFGLGNDANGQLVAGGSFAAIGGVTANNVATWNGSNWTAMGIGLTGTTTIGLGPGVYDFALLPNGNLAATGVITDRVATWDGSSWTALPQPPGLLLYLTELVIDANGDLVAGGQILQGSSVVRYDGTSWSGVGNLDSGVTSMTVLPGGELICCGNSNTSGVFRFNVGASNWTQIGTWNIFGGQMNAVTSFPQTDPGQFYAGGSVAAVSGTSGFGLFFYTAQNPAWIGEQGGASGTIRGMTSFGDGETFVYGQISALGNTPVQGIGRWGQSWGAVGTGLQPNVYGVGRMPDGDLLAGTGSGIFRLTGGTWQVMPGSTSQVTNFLERTNGEMLATSQAGLWRFNGTNWVQVPFIGRVRDMANLPNGDVLLTGESLGTFPISGGRMARWDGSTWTAFDPNWQIVTPLDCVVLDNGDVAVVDGTQNGVQIFDGTNWTSLGSLDGGVRSLQLSAAGDLIAAGSFTNDGQTPCRRVARWEGTGWREIAGGSQFSVRFMTPSANGDVLALWEPTFGTAVLAAHRTACPAAAQVASAGCAGASATAELRASNLPMVGGTYRADATELGSNTIAFDIYGLQSAVLPLANAFSQAAPDCFLTVQPIDVRILAAQGAFESTLTIPAQSSLTGLSLRHQAMLFDFDPQNNLTAISTSNALELTIGSLQ